MNVDRTDPDDATRPDVELKLTLDARINVAMQQNDVPVIKELRLINRGPKVIRRGVLKIVPEPAFGPETELQIADLAPGAEYRLAPVDLVLSPSFLMGVQERVSGALHVSLENESVVIAQSHPVEVLAFNEWSGLRGLPEILAAFVMPNDPALQPLLRETAAILQEWTADNSLCGYQRNSPKQAGTMVAALYEALRRQGFTYINPPASFEQQGQKIRTPEQLMEARMGTCLDLAVLAAACLEQMGLHPLVVLVEGHAFTAVWLIEQTFPVATVYEGSSVRKRIELGEILAFDPTLCTQAAATSFERPVQEAKRCLGEEGAFLCAIDVRRARMGRLRPLPLRREGGAMGTASQQGTEQRGPALPPELALSEEVEETASGLADTDDAKRETPQGRLAAWQGKLLDLTLRNRLLNFRETKQTLPILCPDLATLEDGLAEGEGYQVLAKPEEFDARQGRHAGLHAQRTGEAPLELLLRDQLAAGRLHTSLTQSEVDDRLLKLHRGARTSLEESGVSGLYLALGFLRWYEAEDSQTPRYAPILLVPVALARTTVRGGFSLERSDDDPRLNSTLMELLRRDWGVDVPELEELPEDAAGLDVPKILRIMKRAVRDEPRWEVEETAAVGIFLFTKFMMWADLRDRVSELMTNPVVAHLVDTPELPFESGAAFPEPAELDRRYAPVETFCPLDADSSQLAAVFAAAEGRSFVLQGPPGTGKSQTITNLIAHCLATGHSVLFVSEKMAALNVVRDRLERIGLGPFCLELHSNKANKKEVLRQFKEVLDYGHRREPDRWQHEAASLEQLREELNAYVQALHEPHRNGLTPFLAVDRLVGLREAPLVAFDGTDSDQHTAEELAKLRGLVDNLAVVGHEIEPAAQHPWWPVGKTAWSLNWQRELVRQLGACEDVLVTLERAVGEVLDALQIELSLQSEEGLRNTVLLSSYLQDCPALPGSLFVARGWDVKRAEIEDWLRLGQEAEALREELDKQFKLDVLLDLDVGSLGQQWQLHETAWGPLRWWRQRPIQKLLESTLKVPDTLAADDIPEIFRRTKRLKALQADLTAVRAAAREIFAGAWQGVDSDWELLTTMLERAESIRSVSNALADQEAAIFENLLEHWAALLPEADERFGQESPYGRALASFITAWQAWEDAWKSFGEWVELIPDRLPAQTDQPWVQDRLTRFQRWSESMPRLRDWCTWQELREAGQEQGLGPLIAAFEAGNFDADAWPDAFERSYLDWWYSLVNEEHEILRKFSRLMHEKRIETFRELDSRFMETTRQMIIARLAARLPANATDAHPNSELGRLNREIQKRTRHLPIRKLLHLCRSVVPALKPCFLMSPLSVAQYLSPDHPKFDLVVFDEASQIPVWDAVGAIGRGQRVIVVGDPKQLPPTSFFSRIEDDGGVADDYVEDLESILDECLAAGLPQRELGWHYRSQHEELIAFSNYHYYDNHLLTFPAAASHDLGVHLLPVPEGTYDKGKSRTNQAEAERVVATVVEWLSDPERRQFSLGVVTFSQAQQTLIEDLLDEARANRPEIEYAFADDIAERVFVKNLENVQGDERDIILFSVCYGPDSNGRVSMNFGPLNQSGGERRLNVAITRARRAVYLISTLRADQIDLARTQAIGVRHLKAFLEYAEHGPSVLGTTSYATGGGSDSPLEEEIAQALRNRGWVLHHQVGCSGFRIDLAIVDPEAPGNYLLGIECDGATYHRSKAARDRDKLRQSVLENLGWRIHRIWSTDWWLNPQQEIERLEAVLDDPLLGERRPGAVGANANGAAAAPPPPPPEPARQAAPLPHEILTEYEAYPGAPVGDEDDFDGSAGEQDIRSVVRGVADVECPIAHELLVRRVADAWQLSRLSRKRRRRIEAQIDVAELQRVEQDGALFYWLPEQQPAAYEEFRIHAEDDPHTRAIEDIAMEELGNAGRYVLQTQGGLPAADLAREVAQLFNCKRVTAKAQERLFAAFDRLLEER